MWPQNLSLKWKVEVGAGYATPILIGNRVYTHTRQGENEVMMALDAETGKTVWQTPYAAPYKMNPATKNHGQGPKSTPLFADGRLYTLGISGIVSAFNAADGKLLWQKPAPPVDPLYGTAMSPVFDRGSVIFHVGGQDNGALTAFDAATGNVRWAWAGDGPGTRRRSSSISAARARSSRSVSGTSSASTPAPVSCCGNGRGCRERRTTRSRRSSTTARSS